MLNDFPKYCNRNLYNSIPYSLWIAAKLVSSRGIVKGGQLSALEATLRQQYGCQHVFLTGSGRLAIYIFLRALKKMGVLSHYVLLPFYICPSVPDIVLLAGFKPMFMPVKSDLTLDPDGLSKAKMKTVSAVIIPHIYGYPAAINELVTRIRSINPKVAIIDDAASAYKVTSCSKNLGSYGDAGILSFSQGKLLNASGGGALLLNNNTLLDLVTDEFCALTCLSSREKLKELRRVLWHYGWHRYSDPLSYWFSKISPTSGKAKPTFSQMTNLDAKLINDGLVGVTAIHRERKKIIINYFRKLQGAANIFFPHPPNEGTPPVSRFYMAYNGNTLKLNKDGSIQRHNPLYEYLREHGVKVFYPYLPVKRFLPEYDHFWKDSDWIFSLLGLPVDFKQSIAWHDKVIDMILSYNGSVNHGK